MRGKNRQGHQPALHRVMTALAAVATLGFVLSGSMLAYVAQADDPGAEGNTRGSVRPASSLGARAPEVREATDRIRRARWQMARREGVLQSLAKEVGMVRRHLIALGGGGASSEDRVALLEASAERLRMLRDEMREQVAEDRRLERSRKRIEAPLERLLRGIEQVIETQRPALRAERARALSAQIGSADEGEVPERPMLQSRPLDKRQAKKLGQALVMTPEREARLRERRSGEQR